MKLRTYTLRYLVIALLVVVAVWASLFYMVILDEVYDNINDGLKNSKILIVREAQSNTKILNTPDFGFEQFKITPLPKDEDYDYSDRLYNTFEYSEYDEEDQPVRMLETVFDDAEGNPHKLTIRASMVEEDELLEDLMTALIALYTMLVISIAIVNHLILRKAWKSFYTLLDKLKGFKLGTGAEFQSPDSPVSEFKILGKELEGLLQRNEALYTSQKQFIENASHELQTPLAISLNKLELFAENNDLPEEQMMEIAKVSDTLNRLVRLNKSLLMLSKIENRQFAEEEVINFNELAEQVKEDFSDLADYKNIAINVVHASQLTYTMNKGLALTLLNNLVKNAVVHTKSGGNTRIVIEKKTLFLQNSGDKPLDAKAIFNRFYRETENEQSTGLGLSLAQSIAVNYGLNIEYTFDGNHIFKIIFPER